MRFHPILTAIMLLSLGSIAHADMKAERKAAADSRPRRLIFDNDGNDCLRPDGLTPEGFIRQRTKGMEGTQASTILYCSNAAFGTTQRPSKVWKRAQWKPPVGDDVPVQKLIESGLDPLAEMVKFGKANHMEVFATIRMNDIHDHTPKLEGNRPVFYDNTFKNEHLDWLLGTRAERSKTASWTAVNYAIPGIQDSLLSYAREACENYDIDGLALDFFRHPAFFKCTLAGKPAGDEERKAMTSLMQRIRTMADEIGTKRNRPLLISIRVPDSVDYCRSIGIDLENWLAGDLTDFVLFSSYFQLNDWETNAALAHKYGRKAYASLDESRIADEEGRNARRTDEAMRARTAAAWQGGMDGVATFNIFNPGWALWRQLGDPATLLGQEKHYFASVRGIVKSNGGNLPFGPFQKVETLNPSNPKEIAAGESKTSNIKLGALDPKAKRTLRLRFKEAPDPTSLTVTLGNTALSGWTVSGNWMEAPVENALAAGSNAVTLSLASGQPAPILWMDLMVREKTND